MLNGKFEFMTIKKMELITKANGKVKTSLSRMRQYAESGINKPHCLLYAEFKSKHDPLDVRPCYIVQVPITAHEPAYKSSLSDFTIPTLDKHVPTGWFLFDKPETTDGDDSELSCYKFFCASTEFMELIADIDDIGFGGLLTLDMELMIANHFKSANMSH